MYWLKSNYGKIDGIFKIPCAQEQSDSSLEVDFLVRAPNDVAGDRCLPFDSGGESDDDTSNSYNAATPQRSPGAGRLSDALLKRISANEARRSFRRCRQDPLVAGVTSSTSQLLAKLNLGKRSSSLDRWVLLFWYGNFYKRKYCYLIFFALQKRFPGIEIPNESKFHWSIVLADNWRQSKQQ